MLRAFFRDYLPSPLHQAQTAPNGHVVRATSSQARTVLVVEPDTHLGQVHDLAIFGEDEHPAAEKIVLHAVYKLLRSHAVHEFRLPLPDGGEPVHAPRHHLPV